MITPTFINPVTPKQKRINIILYPIQAVVIAFRMSYLPMMYGIGESETTKQLTAANRCIPVSALAACGGARGNFVASTVEQKGGAICPTGQIDGICGKVFLASFCISTDAKKSG